MLGNGKQWKQIGNLCHALSHITMAAAPVTIFGSLHEPLPPSEGSICISARSTNRLIFKLRVLDLSQLMLRSLCKQQIRVSSQSSSTPLAVCTEVFTLSKESDKGNRSSANTSAKETSSHEAASSPRLTWLSLCSAFSVTENIWTSPDRSLLLTLYFNTKPCRSYWSLLQVKLGLSFSERQRC